MKQINKRLFSSERQPGRKAALSLLLSLLACTALLLERSIKYLDGVSLRPIAKRMAELAFRNPAMSFVLFSGLFLVLFLVTLLGGKRLSDWLWRFRLPLGLILFAVCVGIKLNGSSMGMYHNILYSDVNYPGLKLGVSRGIRSDEWAVLSPIMLSQYTGEHPFSYFSDVVRACQTDVFLEYGAPVRDIAVLFRPFHWGFLFLPAEYGYSFWWCGRFIALFLISLEMGLLLTDGERRAAVIYALLLCFSPLIQWWFAINGLVEMLSFGQLFVLLLRRMRRRNDHPIRKLIRSFLMAVCAGGFVFTVYPVWQVPLGWIFLALCVWAVLSGRENRLQVTKREGGKSLFSLDNIAAILLFIGLFCGLSVYILLKSGDTIRVLASSEYPGKTPPAAGTPGVITRALSGGLGFLYPFSLDPEICDSAQLLNLAPLGLLCSAVAMRRTRKADFLSLTLGLLDLFFCLFLAVPEAWRAANAFFFSYFSAYRTVQVVGFADLLLLIRGLALLKKAGAPKGKSFFLLFSAFELVLLWAMLAERDGANVSSASLAAAVVMTSLLAGGLLLGSLFARAERFSVLMALIAAFLIGGTVNPVITGLSSPYETELGKEIAGVVRDDPEGKWIVETVRGEDVFMNSFPIIFGAPTINSVNIYPQLERWKRLDQEGKAQEIYNRYAHISVRLEEETSFAAGSGPDRFRLNLSPQDLKTLECRYLLSRRAKEELPSAAGVVFSLAGEADGFRVYRLEY